MRILFTLPAVVVLAATAGAQQAPSQPSETAQPQLSLGEVARKTRSQQKAPAIARFDDESLRRTASASDPSPAATDETKAGDDSKKDDSTKDDTKKDAAQAGKAPGGQEKEKQDKKSKAADLGKKIEDQQKEVNSLKRELDILQREQRLRAAAFYGDAGTRLRDQGKFAEDSKQEQDQIDGKKQALDTAQQKLGDLQEEARKAGVSSEQTH